MSKLFLILIIVLETIPFTGEVVKLEESKIEKNFQNTNKNEINRALVFSPYPYKNEKYYPLTTTAASVKVLDMNTAEILFEHNSETRLQIASLTKLMTAKLILEHASLKDTITVKPEYLAKVRIDDSKMGLAAGDTVSYEDLLKGILIKSASDAALSASYALFPGGYDAFILKMNETAIIMKLSNTSYANPVGWDDNNNYSTVSDTATLTRTLLQNEIFKKIVATKKETVKITSGKSFDLENTNLNLDNKIIFGVKTGFTNLAGECLTTLGQVKSHEVLIVLLGSRDRFAETKSILSWVDLVYNW